MVKITLGKDVIIMLLFGIKAERCIKDCFYNNSLFTLMTLIP